MPPPNDNQSDSYHRAYKACLACRQRKSRCEVDDSWVSGNPCRRCKRQMKQCIFPAERMAAKSSPRRLSGTRQQHSATSADGTTDSGDAGFDVHGEAQDQGLASLVAAASQVLPYGDDTAQPDLGEPSDRDLGDSVMRTMISSGSDALQVLFDPVRHDHRPSPGSTTSPYTIRVPGRASPIHEVWNACRFVKHGWFSAEEAIFYVDRFFEHCQPQSPILTDFYSKHEKHYELISSEPLLCCTILAISARYHNLPCMGGSMRSFFIHERLWAHIQHLILRVLLGQEKNSKGKTRTLGSVESFLLLTEWYPRSLAFPPPIDGWDSDLLVHWTENRNDVPVDPATAARGRWLEDVISPAKRTGHMSWMMISSAVSLACELGVFDEINHGVSPDTSSALDASQPGRHLRLRNLLYLYAEQISLQHGRQSVLPQGISHQVLRNPGPLEGFGDLNPFISAWIDLTQLTRVMMETLYVSASHTSQLLKSGRYVNLIEHFRPMLSSWWDKHVGNASPSGLGSYHSFLSVEYYSTRLYCHSLCLQAIIERSYTKMANGSAPSYTLGAACDASDYPFVEEVVNSSSKILMITVQLAENQMLQHAPARTMQRIISGSIFLLKGLGIGVDAMRLHSSLELLQRAIEALRTSAIDEMQLGLRYATLLDMHLTRLRRSFVSSAYPPGILYQGSEGTGGMLESAMEGFESNLHDWVSLPLDTAFPAANGVDVQGFSTIYDQDLDFLWNLDFES